MPKAKKIKAPALTTQVKNLQKELAERNSLYEKMRDRYYVLEKRATTAETEVKNLNRHLNNQQLENAKIAGLLMGYSKGVTQITGKLAPKFGLASEFISTNN